MTQLSTSINPVPDNWIDALFAKMSTYYGNKFSDMWRDSNMQAIKSVWSQELRKISREDFTKGANALMTQEWPPTLPQFISLCRVKINPLSAYYEAINGVAARDRGEIGEWSHPAVFWASVKVGAFDLKNQSYAAVRARWDAAFDEEMAKGQWAAIPQPMVALPAPAPVSKEVAERYIAETQVIKKQDSQADHKQWAKLIMQRNKEGDKTLTHIQISFAKEALANEMY